MYVMQNSNHTVFDYESYLGNVEGVQELLIQSNIYSDN